MAKKFSEDPVLADVKASDVDGTCNRCEVRTLAGERFLLEGSPVIAEWLCQDCYDKAKA